MKKSLISMIYIRIEKIVKGRTSILPLLLTCPAFGTSLDISKKALQVSVEHFRNVTKMIWTPTCHKSVSSLKPHKGINDLLVDFVLLLPGKRSISSSHLKVVLVTKTIIN